MGIGIQRRYEAIKLDGTRIKTQYSPTIIMLVSEMVDKGLSVDAIVRVTGASPGSIGYISTLDPVEDEDVE